ncbi:MAG: ABC transporter ATP-binding protein/permease [Gammaproteobacteria bacterium]|nr:ABC transporter ATP-binding protein/permease [Gammaproteobacteria bacterium]
MPFIPRTENPKRSKVNFKNIEKMFPYIWNFKSRVIFALIFLIIAKLATVGVPILLKDIVDSLNSNNTLMILPLGLLIAYGLLRLTTAFFNELRDVLFAKIRYHAVYEISVKVLTHLHKMSLRFHLERQTGSIIRDLERGTQSLSSLINYMIFIILPTIIEVLLVGFILILTYDINFALITFSTIIVYILFTLKVTNWRMSFRHDMNKFDSEANSIAVDSLLNYETVKYFNNEKFEIKRFSNILFKWENSAMQSMTTMSLLNFGQAFIITIGVTLIMIEASMGVITGAITLGDLVLINALMLQLFVPLNTLGIVYRQIIYALADMDMLVKLLEKDIEITDKKNSKDLKVTFGNIKFDNVSFSYNENRKILKNVSLNVPSGKKIAIVGPSGAGKSTLGRLLFRFYDSSQGRILIDDQNINNCTQSSLRKNIAVVPQDTVLFNESIYFNIKYAKNSASKDDVVKAAKMANIHDFINSLPDKYNTIVGERGLKLSGGEKQRVAIARAVLKSPKIIIFDEATSSLDSNSENKILQSMKEVSKNITSLIIAHRLSTIKDADNIYVLNEGQIIESGNHDYLLSLKGTYSQMWNLQKSIKK